jgi:hypothetical protein
MNENTQAAVRAKYADIDAHIEQEANKEALGALVRQRELEEQDARTELEAAKRRTREAKKAHASADADFRATRRTQNARIQAEAASLGAKRYDTGTPCRNGHYAPRYTSSGSCTLCDKIGWVDGHLRAVSAHD